jgi:TonB family protein
MLSTVHSHGPVTLLLSGIAALLGAATAQAQTCLLVTDGDKVEIVRAARGPEPLVLRDGVLTPARPTRVGLKEAPEYLPFLVGLSDMSVTTEAIESASGAGELNRRMLFHATVTSPVALDNVFVALELKLESGTSIFLWGMDSLRAGEPAELSIRVPIHFDAAPGKYLVHVFSGGVETFNSSMRTFAIENALDTMVRKRTQGVSDENLSLFVHPTPIYPHEFKGHEVPGKALISVLVDRNGAVRRASVKSATRPEFGRAALAAVSQWRFLPVIRGGVPQEIVADIPFNFSAPL